MNKIFGFCLLAMLAVAGCKDKCDDYSNYHKIDDRMNSYFFNEGTYWIYQNSVTGEIDSEYVSSVRHYLDTSIYMKYTCGTNLGISEVVSIIHKSSLSPGKSLNWQYGAMSNGISIELGGSYSVIFALDNREISNGPCLYFRNSFDSLNIQTETFFTVDFFTADISESQCNSILTYTTDFYFSPHFGVMKKVEYNTPNGTQEWNLIRWHIVQ